MYRQILVQESDQDFQRIIWLTYGTGSAPFLAARCLKEVGMQNKVKVRTASNAIINDFYVDDFISGAENIDKAIKLQQEVSTLLQNRHFPLRKWMSNSPELLQHISKGSEIDFKDLNIANKHLTSTKVLGLHWQPEQDYFTYRVNINSTINITKRTILSESSKIFDPLGFLSPCVISVKIILQNLWLQNVNWDDELSIDVTSKWKRLYEQFIQFEEIKIQRWIKTPGSQIELIGFCDASELAYSAAIYIKTKDETDAIKVNLLVAKSKVAPLKKLTIPRLELCGASLLTKLYIFACSSLNLSSVKMTAFTDSSVILSWIASQPNRWKPYVANRVSQIISTLPASVWKHVSSKQNPTDCASRGISPEQLLHHNLWWHGPLWLVQPSSEWPKPVFSSDGSETEKESRKIFIKSFHCNSVNETLDNLFTKISSLTKILRIISLCRRVMKTANTTPVQYLQSKELEDSLQICIKSAQHCEFKNEIKLIQNNKTISNGNCLKNLKPFLDKQGILRVLGRIQHSQASYDTKHPYIIPKNHQLARLLIRLLHIKHLHAGATLLTNIIKLKYWIIGCRYMVKKEIHNCVVCVRHRGQTQAQLMGSLPKQRVTPSRTFSRTGLDYAGPFTIKRHQGRNPPLIKAYSAVFVCLSTKAAHLELVSDMTADCFIAALRRFIGRRGLPAELLSDNGSTFIGAKHKLHELHSAVLNSKQLISEFCAHNNILWKMIPPASPHMGGLWESCVKSVKNHLKRVVSNHPLTFEELFTLLIQIEAQLNSRPLAPLYENDPDNLDVITPGHFLIGSPLAAIAEPNIADDKISIRNRWHLINKMQQDIWKKWHCEYLNTLQQRKKWQNVQENLQIGDIILINDENLPPLKLPVKLPVSCKNLPSKATCSPNG